METRRRSKRDREDQDLEEGSEKRRKMESKLEEILAQITDSRRELKAEMGTVRDEMIEEQRKMISEIDAKVKQVDDKVENIERRVDKIGGEMGNLKRRMDEVERGSRRDPMNSAQTEAYWRARRAVQIGPVQATSEDQAYDELVGVFEKELKIPNWEVRNMIIEHIAVVVRRRNGGEEIRMVKVIFESVEDRDRVFSKVVNAGDGLKMEMVVPNHLNGKFKLLEKKAYEERKKGKKTLIRYKDEDLDLQLLTRDKIDADDRMEGEFRIPKWREVVSWGTDMARSVVGSASAENINRV